MYSIKFLKIWIFLFMFLVSMNVFADDSINSIVNINVLGTYGPTFGMNSKMMDDEHEAYQKMVIYSDGTTESGKPLHEGYNYGIFMDIMPFGPYISKSETKAIIFGLRTKYAANKINQYISIGDGKEYENKSWDSKYMNYNTILGGPVLYFTFGYDNGEFSSNTGSNYILSIFALYGRILNGELIPASILQSEEEISFEKPYYNFDGWRLETGLGFEYSRNSSVHIGINIYYGLSFISLEEKIYTNVSKETSISDVSLEIYFGVSI